MLRYLLDCITSPIIHVGTFPLSLGDLGGFATGLICVALAAKGSIWNYPLGLANCMILGLVFFQSKLFGDMSLQFVFFVLGVLGWIQWILADAKKVSLPKALRVGDFLWGLLVVCLFTFLLREVLTRIGGSAPWLDAIITSASLWAQWLLNKKSISTWAWWIVVDLVSIPLYFSRQLPLIAVLYVFFLVLCIQGWLGWRKALVK
jgi:nicotinamide mononucleotide transporter